MGATETIPGAGPSYSTSTGQHPLLHPEIVIPELVVEPATEDEDEDVIVLEAAEAAGTPPLPVAVAVAPPLPVAVAVAIAVAPPLPDAADAEV